MFYKITEPLRALSLVDSCVYMRVFKHGCDASDLRVFLKIISLKQKSTFPYLQSLVLTLGGLVEFSKVMQIRDYVSGLHNCLEFSQPSSRV